MYVCKCLKMAAEPRYHSSFLPVVLPKRFHSVLGEIVNSSLIQSNPTIYDIFHNISDKAYSVFLCTELITTSTSNHVQECFKKHHHNDNKRRTPLDKD